MAAHVFSGVNTVQAFILLHVGPYLEGQLELAVAVSRETTDANRKAWGITLQRFVRKRRIMKERKLEKEGTKQKQQQKTSGTV